jgi:hypothetical protein
LSYSASEYIEEQGKLTDGLKPAFAATDKNDAVVFECKKALA